MARGFSLVLSVIRGFSLVLACCLALNDLPQASQPTTDTGPTPIAQIEHIIVSGSLKLEPAAGDVRVVRAQQIVAARPALPLFENDEILTGPDVTARSSSSRRLRRKPSRLRQRREPDPPSEASDRSSSCWDASCERPRVL